MEAPQLLRLLLTTSVLRLAQTANPFVAQQTPPDPCYDESGAPRRCIPEFVNAAFGKEVQASSTCGKPPTRHCDASDPRRAHPPAYLTDLNTAANAVGIHPTATAPNEGWGKGGFSPIGIFLTT